MYTYQWLPRDFSSNVLLVSYVSPPIVGWYAHRDSDSLIHCMCNRRTLGIGWSYWQCEIKLSGSADFQTLWRPKSFHIDNIIWCHLLLFLEQYLTKDFPAMMSENKCAKPANTWSIFSLTARPVHSHGTNQSEDSCELWDKEIQYYNRLITPSINLWYG